MKTENNFRNRLLLVVLNVIIGMGAAYVDARTVNTEAVAPGGTDTIVGNSHLCTVSVTEFGAVGDTAVLSTAAFNSAIDRCASSGGGTVVVPPGEYLCTTILLKDNVTLHLQSGATVYASRNAADYADFTRSSGAADTGGVETLLLAVSARNVSVTGGGVLHCRAVREKYIRDPQTHITDSITGREIENAKRYGADYRTKFRKVPPYVGALSMVDCENVRIEGIRVIESSFWSVHIQGCDRVKVDGIYIESDRNNGVNADGLDIDGCTNVTISNCVIRTGDDALCLKSTMHDGVSKPVRNITINNCILTSSSAAFKIGTETHSDFENIVMTNCIIDDANRGLNIIVRDGGNVRRVIFSDIVIRTRRKATFWWGNGDPLWFTIQKRGKSDRPAGSISDVIISNVIADSQSGLRMEGFDEALRNITVSDFHLTMQPEEAVDKRSRNAFFFHGVDGLTLRDCSVEWNTDRPEKEWESAYLFRKVTDLELVRVYGDKAPNGRYPAFRYDNVSWKEDDNSGLRKK